MIDLHKINLNLLVAFDLLYQEKSVTKAARRGFVTQSTMSFNLSQLREIFHDKLFTRVTGGITPTKLAKELAIKIREVLEGISAIFFMESKFDSTVSDRVFNVGVSEYIEFILLPNLYRYLFKYAPNITLQLKRMPLKIADNVAFIDSKHDVCVGSALDNQRSAQINRQLLF